MRSVFAISSAIALFATSAFASENADFNPVNFADKAVSASASLTNEFVNFRWKGEEATAQESFDLNVENTARIQVTDFKNRGDMFEIFDNGKSLGFTTKVDALKDEEVFAATPEEALNDERFSKGTFDLAKGEHKITIKAVGPYEAGTAAIRVLDHANVAFHKKEKDHDDDHDDDDDDDDKHDHKDDDDDDDDDKHDHKGDDDDDKHDHKGDDDDEGRKGSWHKDDRRKGGDHEGKGSWNKGGDRGEGHQGEWNKGGDFEVAHEGGWNKGGDFDEAHQGGWNKGGDFEGGHQGGDKWEHKRPTEEEYDLSHTITFTKTKWVAQRPTRVPNVGTFTL